MANDPFASASFLSFHHGLETLFAVQGHTGKCQVEIQMGIFGYVNVYFRVVEAQGRGSLHIHMLLWLHQEKMTMLCRTM